MKKLAITLSLCFLFIAMCGIAYVYLPKETVHAPVVPQSYGEDEDGSTEPLANIHVAYPVEGEVVGFPLALSGQARVFENVVEYRVLDDAGTILASGFGSAASEDIGEFGYFSFLIAYDAPVTPGGVVEVFSTSAKDGSEEYLVQIPVQFSEDISVATTEVYFIDRAAVAQTCDQTVAVSRRVANVPAIARVTMDALLEGARPSEPGLLSLIPQEARIRSILIEDGVATVTFAPGAFSDVAGSCMVAGIRAQITATLAQFSTIDSVIILEEGKSPDEILQP